MIRLLAVAIAALFALVSMDAVAAEEPGESSPPSAPKKRSKKSHKAGPKKADAKPGASKKLPPPAEPSGAKVDKYAATQEKMRDIKFSLEGLTHLEQRPTDFVSQSELVGGVQGEKQKVKKLITRASNFCASQKFRNFVRIDDEAKRFKARVQDMANVAVANGWIDD